MKKIITLCIFMLLTIPVISTFANEINPLSECSNTPCISGPKNGVIGEIYDYEIKFKDPEGDDVYYNVYWGDCQVIFKAGPYKSDEVVKFSHAWCEICAGPGKFTIRVRASDENGHVSHWGAYIVNMDAKKNRTIPNYFEIFIEKLIERFPVLEKIFVF